MKNLDAVYPCSQDGAACIDGTWPGFSQKIHTAYLGTHDFGPGPRPRPGGTYQIVSCCHLSPVKRVKLLAQALSLLKDSGIPCKWTHIGGGDELADLKAYAAEHLSFMQVEFTGPLPNQKLMEFYRETPINLFVNTSSSEGLPVSIMEAASFGIPAMATDVGGTKELVREGETGWLLPADCSPEMLATHLKAAIACPAVGSPAAAQELPHAVGGNVLRRHKNFTAFAQAIQPL